MLIYLVDDDQEDQEIFDMALAESGVNANLVCFNNATAAIENLRDISSHPNYIFLDLNMPKINGLECLQILAKDSFTTKSRIVIYSTSSNERDIHETKALGAYQYLIKPVSFTSLVDSIRSIIEA